MRIYQFPIRRYSHQEANTYQLIDLDYIVSVGPVDIDEDRSLSGYPTRVFFDLFIKLGNPIRLQRLVSHSSFGSEYEHDKGALERDRQDLISAWQISGGIPV